MANKREVRFTEEQVKQIVKETISQQLTEIQTSLKDLSLIKQTLLGDGSYIKTGLLDEHKAMYEAYRVYSTESFPTRLDTLWELHTGNLRSGFYDSVEEIIKLFRNLKFMTAALGITSIASVISLIISVYALLSLLGKL
jgi:hypothetical protein